MKLSKDKETSSNLAEVKDSDDIIVLEIHPVKLCNIMIKNMI